MSQYRIIINELNNGKKEYSPQYLKPSTFGRLFKSAHWHNILQDGGRFSLSKSTSEWYNTEEDALNTINKHKSVVEYKNSRKIKKTSYKMID